MSKTHDQLFTDTSAGGQVSRCQIAIYQRPGDWPVLLLTERDDNPGPSITTTMEDAASAAWRALVPGAEGV